MNVRSYGTAPFRVAVLHGGPGAPGYMAPVARELSGDFGVLEPLQTRDSLRDQVAELREQLARHADPPVTLIGSSWGAVLALFTAADDPSGIQKLILVGVPGSMREAPPLLRHAVWSGSMTGSGGG